MKIEMEDTALKQLLEDIENTEENIFDFDGCFCGVLEYPIGYIDGREIYLLLNVNCQKSGLSNQEYYEAKDFKYSIGLSTEEDMMVRELLDNIKEMDCNERQYEEISEKLSPYVEHNFGGIISKKLTNDTHLSKEQEKKIREAIYNRYCESYCWSSNEDDFPLNASASFKI